MSPHPVENLIRGELAKAATELQKSRMTREFQALGEDRYVLQVPDLGVTLHIDRLRRESGELWGELSVQCDLPGAKVVNGDSISVADFNMSSARSRIDRAKLIDSRVGVKGIDWHGIVEDFCQRSLDQDRIGRPAIDLRKVEKPCEDAYFDVLGLRMPRAHPSILFGDGGTGKSYIALYIAGKLIENGVFRSVALFDWELSAEDHRERLERLFPDGMPMIHYVSCDRPLVYEVDRLKRIVQGAQIGYAIYDSVAFATNGPPEAAEMASQYFRCVRQIGCGGLHVAHVNKQMDSEKKPFGCHSRDTDVLTKRGWVRHENVTLNHEVACFDLKSGMLRWERPTQLHRYRFDGNMLHLTGASLDFLVTPNHRMVVKKPVSGGKFGKSWRFIEAGTINGTPLAIPYGCQFSRNEEIQIEYRDSFARFLGWWISEGCLNDNAPVLTQRVSELADRMCDAVEDMGYSANKWVGKTREYEQTVMQLRLRKATALGKWLRRHAGSGAKNKRIPKECFNWPEQKQRLLFEALMEGDGHKHNPGRWTYFTISPRLADDVQRLAIILGYTGRIREDEPPQGERNTRYSVMIGSRKHLTIKHYRRPVELVDYHDDVFCLTVPTGAYLTRRNGYAGISGNSAFWWNGARSIWFAKRSEQLSGDEENMEVGLFHRKSNLGKLRPPVGWKLSFQGSITSVRPCPITDASDLMDQLTLRQRMTMLLRRGPLDQQRLCEELDADRETVSRTLRRHKSDFVVLEGGRVGLMTKDALPERN